VAQARAQLSSDQTQFSKASIRSPVNGVVLSRQVEPGQTVAASFNAPVLFLIAEDLSKMQLEAKVDEADVGTVKEGQRATFTVDAFPGRRFPAQVQRVDVGANASGSSGSSSSSSSTASSAALGTRTTFCLSEVTISAVAVMPGRRISSELLTVSTAV
jgi:HlyD family secretion protein